MAPNQPNPEFIKPIIEHLKSFWTNYPLVNIVVHDSTLTVTATKFGPIICKVLFMSDHIAFLNINESYTINDTVTHYENPELFNQLEQLCLLAIERCRSLIGAHISKHNFSGEQAELLLESLVHINKES